MKFVLKEPQTDQNFALIYRDEEYSFDVEPLDGSGDSSIMVNDLQLEIDHTGKIIYVWGLCPLIEYEETNEAPHEYKAMSLVAVLGDAPVLGISYRLNEDKRWPVYINKKEGWVCLGSPDEMGNQMIEFAPGSVATMKNDEIIALWLHPEKLPKSA